MTPAFSSALFDQLPIVGILRGLPADKLQPVMAAVSAGGLTNLEVTMNTPDAAEQIRAACRLAGQAMNIGAGTVTSIALLEVALAAGATFIVTPTVAVPVIESCVQRQVPVFPGACSPGEILQAWELGATMVKVFPADVLGPGYIRALKRPFPQVRLMPTGGVDATSLGAYLRAGADAFGVGSPLFSPGRIAAGDWDWMRNQTCALREAYAAAIGPHRSPASARQA
jgi:2-dehydro-3-deoxyphosphogluconate aldolase/(4S)-4-hydroxy-2-oxoglutarate aldolase